MISTGKKISCTNCGERFYANTKRRVFCSDRCRVTFNRSARSCFYCGSCADSKDHITPHSTTIDTRRHWKTDWVNACRECNVMLSDVFPSSLYDRIMFLHDTFKRKKKLNKCFIEWDEEDLHDMSEHMRTWISNKQQERWENERRLSHIRIVALTVLRHQDDPDFIPDDDDETVYNYATGQ
jgi:hypothetical protein